jgi:hypothetical protein
VLQRLRKKLQNVAVSGPALAKQVKETRAEHVTSRVIPVGVLGILWRLIKRCAKDVQIGIIEDFIKEAPRNGSLIEWVEDQVILLQVFAAELTFNVVDSG